MTGRAYPSRLGTGGSRSGVIDSSLTPFVFVVKVELGLPRLSPAKKI